MGGESATAPNQCREAVYGYPLIQRVSIRIQLMRSWNFAAMRAISAQRKALVHPGMPHQALVPRIAGWGYCGGSGRPMAAYISAKGTTRPCNGSTRSTFSPSRSMFCARFTVLALGTAGGAVLGAAGV
jgi:hypothetical protein